MKKFRSSILVSLMFLSIGKLCLSMESKDNKFSAVERIFKNPISLPRDSQRIFISDKMSVYHNTDEGIPKYVVTDLSFESLEEALENIQKLKKLVMENYEKFEIEWRIFTNQKPILGKVLEDEGFKFDHLLDVIAYSLNEDFEPSIMIDSAIKIEALKEDSIAPWASIVGEAFHCIDHCNSETYHKTVENGINKISDERFYAGYYNDQLVATGAVRMVKGEDIGYVFATTTHPDFRNKGLATAMSLHILRRAKEVGLKYIVLMTSKEEIRKICKKGNCTKVFDSYRYKFNYPA